MSKKVILANIIVVVIIFILFGSVGLNFVNNQTNQQEWESKIEGLKFELGNLQKRVDQAEVNYMYGKATAYHPPSGGINSDNNPEVTSIGKPAEVGVIAVNPEVIPYHSGIMIISGDTVIRGKALDTGGDMRADPRHVDILMDCVDEANDWGVREGVHIIWW